MDHCYYFNIFINDLLYISRGSEINTYADDTQFFISGLDAVTIQLSMQADLQSASQWFHSNGMALNVDRCLSKRVGSNSEDLPLQLRNGNLQLSSSMKLLGMTIDNALNFCEHVSGLVRKVSNQLQVHKRHKRLIPTGAKKHLYEAFILSHLNIITVLLSGFIVAKRMLINQRKLMRDASALSSMTFMAITMNY